MPSCLVPGCRPSSSSHASYHSMPKSKELAKYWLEVCGRLDLLNSKLLKNAKICSAHFSKADYKNHLQYTMMTSGSSAARPRLKEDAVPTFVTQGWKRIRTAPREIRMAPARDSQRDHLRQQYVSQALREYETGQLSGDPVQDIRSRLKMRRARRPDVQVVQVDRRDGQVLVGGTFRELSSAAAAGREARETGAVRVFTSRGITEQLAAESGDDLDVQALRLLQDANDGAQITRSSPKSATTSSIPRHAQSGMGTASNKSSGTSVKSARRGADRLPAAMPDRFRAVLGRQRTICSLQLTLRRQTEQLEALQARHELDLEEQGFDEGAEAALFPPADTSLAGEDTTAGGDMLLSPATLEEATAELHRLRTEVLELRTGLLEGAVVANERALAANSQRAELLRVFTPRQADILVGRRARSDVWDAEDLRRAIALRRTLTRHQYEHLRTALRLPLPALRSAAASLQTDPTKRSLYRRLLDQRRPGLDRPASPGDSGAAATLRQQDELLVLRGVAAADPVGLGRWDGLEAGSAEHADGTEGKEQVEHTNELVEEVDPMELAELLHDQTVMDEVEVGWEDEVPASAPRSRPMKVAITPAHRDDLPLESHESLWGDFI